MLEVEREMRRVDVLGGEAARRVAPRTNPFARVDAVREFLFEELRFRGNSESYDDPRNSYLNEVLDRRLGIPLTLSLLYLEVAARAGLVVRGVALPGHFIARVDEQGRTLFVDPFHGGGVVTEEDCRDLVFRTTGRAALFRRDILEGASGTQMLSRLLLNLKPVVKETSWRFSTTNSQGADTNRVGSNPITWPASRTSGTCSPSTWTVNISARSPWSG